METTILRLFVVSLTLQLIKCQNFAGLMTFFDGNSNMGSMGSGNCPYQAHRTFKTKYIQKSNFQNIVRDCAPGTEYDQSKCSCVTATQVITPQRGSNPRINTLSSGPPAGLQDIMTELFRRFQNQPGGGINDITASGRPRPDPPLIPQSRSPTNQMEQVRRIIRTRPTDAISNMDIKTTTTTTTTTTTAPPPPPIIPKKMNNKKRGRKNKRPKKNPKGKNAPKNKKEPTARLIIDASKVKPGPPYNPTPRAQDASMQQGNKKNDNINTFINFVKSQMNADTKNQIPNPTQDKPMVGAPNTQDNLLTQGPPPLAQGPTPDISKLLQQNPPPDFAKMLQQGPPPDFAKMLQQGSPPDFAKMLQQGPPPDFAKLLQQGPPPEFAKMLQQGPPPDFAKLLQQGPPPDFTKLLQQNQAKESANILKQAPLPETIKNSQNAASMPPINTKNTNNNFRRNDRISSKQGNSKQGFPVNLNNAQEQNPIPSNANNMAQDNMAILRNILQGNQGLNGQSNGAGPVIGPTADPMSTLLTLLSSINQQPEANPGLALSSNGNGATGTNTNGFQNNQQSQGNMEQSSNLPLSDFIANLRQSNPGRGSRGGAPSSRMGAMNPLMGGSGGGSSNLFGNLGGGGGLSGGLGGGLSGGIGSLGGGGGPDISALLAGMGGSSGSSSGLGALGGLNLAGLGGAAGALGAAGARSASPPDLTNVFNMQGRMRGVNMADLANVNHLLLNQMDRQGYVDVSDLTPAGLIAASKHFSRAGGAGTAALLG